MGNLCMQIIFHGDFIEVADTPAHLLHLVQGGLLEAMQALLEHPGFEPHIQDALPDALVRASSRGLPLHFEELLKYLPPDRKAPRSFHDSLNPLHTAANLKMVQQVLTAFGDDVDFV